MAAIAKLQRGRVSRDQLLAAGITKSMIQTMLRTGSLRRRRRGVFAVGHEAPAELAIETEALLSPRAVIAATWESRSSTKIVAAECPAPSASSTT